MTISSRVPIANHGNKWNKLILIWFALFALVMFVMVLIGEYRLYTPIPLQDSWDGIFTFYYSMLEHGPSLIWQKHNEHRIILSRMMFVVNQYLFHGATWPLRLANLVLVGIAALIFWRILQRLSQESKMENIDAIALMNLGLLYSWIQQDNLAWEFQGQFFLAQLVPLCGFYWLAKSSQSPKSPLPFFIALLFGLASYGTMANGVLAIPLMLVFAILLGQSRFRILLLFFVGVFCTALYFRGFPAHSESPMLLQVLINQPKQFIQFIFYYLGSPFLHVFHKAEIAFIFGLIYVALLVFFLKYLLRPRKNAYEISLIFFLIYILATALVTAGGRLHFGLYSAFTSRYTTPTLMAWCAIIILCARSIPQRKWLIYGFIGCLGLISAGFMRYQFAVFTPQYTEITYEQKIAGLALEMGIPDPIVLRTIYQDSRVIQFAEEVRPYRPSFFGQYPYLDLREQLDQKISLPTSMPICDGAINAIDPIEGNPKFVRVRGWMRNENGRAENLVTIVNSQDKVVGFALGREQDNDLNSKNNISAGFIGYMQSNFAKQSVILLSANKSCKLVTTPSPEIYSAREVTPNPLQSQVSQINIISAQEWRGSDEERSGYPGFKIYGSFINSSKDKGSVILKLQRGDTVFYKGGPVWNNQVVEVLGTSMKYSLPYSPRWSNWYLMEFSSQNLPSGEFSVRFSDNGSSYGEWSAIAVKQ